MAVINIALLTAILPAVFAMPQHAHLGHLPHKARNLPSDYPTGFPHPSGVPGTAPYPSGNGTVGGPTGTASVPLSTGGAGGPVTIQSTINIVPMPITKSEFGSPASTGLGGVGNSPDSGSGSGSESGSGSGSGSESGNSGETCGPATVTITHANTVTVTVPGSNGAGPSGAPETETPASSTPVSGAPESAAPGPSVPAVSSAPYPVGNSSVPAGPTGTGTPGTDSPSIPSEAPVSEAPVVASSTPASSTPEAAISTPASSTPVAETSAPVIPSAAPVEAESSAAPVTSSVEANALYKAPAKKHHSSTTPVAPAPEATTTPVIPVEQPSTSAEAPVQSASSVSSAAPSQTSTTPKTPKSGNKARGLLYGGADVGAALEHANEYLSAGSGAMGWGWNWDSSPQPQTGAATGTLDVEFVPMLLSLDQVHVDAWKTNAKGNYLMAFNEPDMTKDKGGAQMSVEDCVKGYKDHMQPHASGSTKLISPATTNNLEDTSMGIHFMSNFLQQCSDCTIDVLAFHYYGDAADLEYFKDTVSKYQKLQNEHGIPELWITEMAPNQTPTGEQMTAFLEFLDDAASGVTRYAFNGLKTGTGQSLEMPEIQKCYQA